MATREHTPRRRGWPSTYRVRTEELDRLFYATNHSDAEGMAARAVLADAFRERGLVSLANALDRFPRGQNFGHSLLREKVRRAIFGPQQRQSYTPRKPRREVLLAQIDDGPADAIDHWFIDSDYGRNYVFTMSVGYWPIRFLVRADDESSALEIAQEQWPNWFFDEVDAEDEEDPDFDFVDENDGVQPHPTKPGIWVRPTEEVHVRRARWIARGRVLESAGSGYRGTAYVPGRGIVEYVG